MRIVSSISAFLALAAFASAEEPADNPPAIRLTTLPNPITDPVASANRRANLDAAIELKSLPGVFSIAQPGSPIRYAWDPVECRLLFCQRDADLIYLAEGPGPAAPTVGAFGTPEFFGYRIVEGGIPEFLYMNGRLGVEEQIRPSTDGNTLRQLFRVENADFGLVLAIPERWKDRVKSSAGSWSKDVLKISESDAKKGFTLTYDLSEPPELPEVSKSWSAPTPEDARAGPPPPPSEELPEFQAEAAPGFTIELIPLPEGRKLESLALFGDDGLITTTQDGAILISTAGKADNGEEREWSAFLGHPLSNPRIVDASRMPDSLLVTHAYGNARLFDTDNDGRADFFKPIRTQAGGESPPSRLLTIPDWDLFKMELRTPENASAAGLFLQAQGLNPDLNRPQPSPESAVWIPGSLCANPASPLILAANGTGMAPDCEIVIPDRSSAGQWRFARVMLDRVGNTLQGAVTDSHWAVPTNCGIGMIAASKDGKTLWAAPSAGGNLARITADSEHPAFEVRSVHQAPDAFEFSFTRRIDRKSAAGLERSPVRSAEPGNGGIEHDHLVEAAIVDSDGMALAIRVAGVTPGCLLTFDLSKLRSESGDALSHGPVFYTVNVLPEFPLPESPSIQPANSTASSDSAGETNSEESSRESKPAPESP